MAVDESLCLIQKSGNELDFVYHDKWNVSVRRARQGCNLVAQSRRGGFIETTFVGMGKRHGHVWLERFEHGGLARLTRTEKEDAFSAFKYGGNGCLYDASLINHAHMIPYPAEICNYHFQISPNFESGSCIFRLDNATFIL